MCMHVCVCHCVCFDCVFIVCFVGEMSCGTHDRGVGKATVLIRWPSFYVCVYKMTRSGGK